MGGRPSGVGNLRKVGVLVNQKSKNNMEFGAHAHTEEHQYPSSVRSARIQARGHLGIRVLRRPNSYM